MARKTKAQLIEDMKREAKRVRDRNYRFRKMTPERQRTTIAQDVLDLIAAEKIVAASGTYLEFDEDVEVKYFGGDGWDDDLDEYMECEPIESAKDVQLHRLIEESPSCEVCGIGACFVAAVRRADKAKVGDMSHSNDDAFMRQYLSQWFSRNQISLIECAFEQSTCFNRGGDPMQLQAERAMRFGQQFDDDTDRLEAIFKNIVANNGTFVV
jgi:hypothetical protein